jgi:uncharacterized protein YndB with AHSA1/START domain
MPGAAPIVIKRVLPAPRPRVFRAFTVPEVMARWFFPSPNWTAKITADVRVGGGYAIAMRDEAGGVHEQLGQYKEIEPVSKLVFSWTCHEVGVVDSLVTIELAELQGDRGGRTALTLTHVLPAVHPDLPTVYRRHEEGWTGCLGHLEVFLGNQPMEGKHDGLDQ